MDFNQNPTENQTPYGTPKPYGYPYRTPAPTVKKANSMAVAAMTLGILSPIFAFTCTIYPALICGGISIILALLSKGAEPKMHGNAKTGVIMAITGLVLNVVIVSATLMLIFSPASSPEYREEFNKTYEQLYGRSFDDTIDEIMGDS